jgi:hypothetical protein
MGSSERADLETVPETRNAKTMDLDHILGKKSTDRSHMSHEEFLKGMNLEEEESKNIEI